MNKSNFPRYPIYIPSKGRAERCLTALLFEKEGIDFQLVVEPQEEHAYSSIFGKKRIIVLPFANLGSVIPARNYIKKYAIEKGYIRHWQFDDNIRAIRRLYRGLRIPCDSGAAIAATEDFVDRYENVAIAGLNYQMFGIEAGLPPFYINVHVYSCSLILNSLPYQWRGRYNEDTDICL